ncbi:HNH endonuclease [Streptomyces finlayi]
MRECQGCGNPFPTVHNWFCSACRSRDRECPECNRVFSGTRTRCPGCEATERDCADCGTHFFSRDRCCGPCKWKQVPPEIRTNQSRAYSNARRARLLAAEGKDKVTAAEYAAIRAAQECVYCGRPAAHQGDVDHIRPLTRGGRHEVSNLVLSCIHCNRSKHNSLLIRWRPDRVQRACRVSRKVAAEYARQMAEGGRKS